MIKEFEKQILLTQKTNQLLEEIRSYTEDLEKENKKNLTELKSIVETDVKEIIEYCGKMELLKDCSYLNPSFYIELTRDRCGDAIKFELIYNTLYSRYEWFIGKYKNESFHSNFNYEGLFFMERPFSNWTPTWMSGHPKFDAIESEIVQYICTNWTEIKEKIITKIAAEVAKKNEKKLNKANQELIKNAERLMSSKKELNKEI